MIRTVRELITELEKHGQDRTFYVCVDTSGDTGEIVIEGENLFGIEVPGVY